MGDYEDGQRDAAFGYRDEGRAWTSWDYDQGNKNPCFTGDTLIRTPGGDRRIDSLNRGDVVMAWSSRKQALIAQPVTGTTAHPPTVVFILSLANGASVKATANHQFLSGRGWRRLDQLTAGDVLQVNSQEHRIMSVERQMQRERVYNIVPRHDHTYLVSGGIIVHSFSRFRVLQHWFHRVGEALSDLRFCWDRIRPSCVPIGAHSRRSAV